MTMQDIINYYNSLKKYIEPVILDKVSGCCIDDKCSCDREQASVVLTDIIKVIDNKGYAICDSLNNYNICKDKVRVTFFTFVDNIRHTFDIIINIHEKCIEWSEIKMLELNSFI